MPNDMGFDSILVHDACLTSDEPAAVLASNDDVVTRLLSEHLLEDECAPAAIQIWHVDRLVAEVLNGGFSQYVYNLRGDASAMDRCARGLAVIGASEELRLYSLAVDAVAALHPRTLRRFLEGDYFGGDPTLERLNEMGEALFAQLESRTIETLQARWVRAQPNLVPLSSEALQLEIERRIDAVPWRFERMNPDERTARELCRRAGFRFVALSSGSHRVTVSGAAQRARHVVTDQGGFFMVRGHADVTLWERSTGRVYARMNTA